MNLSFLVCVATEIDYKSSLPVFLESHSAKATLKYTIRIEPTSWGVREILVEVPEQELVIKLSGTRGGDEDSLEFECRVLIEADSISADLSQCVGAICPARLDLKLECLNSKQSKRTLIAKGVGTLVFYNQEVA